MNAAIKTLSAGCVVLRDTAAGWRYLLLRCYKLWDFPKGLVEADESPLEAALREVAEETSLRGLELHWGAAYRDTEIYAKGKVARYFLALSRSGEVILGVNPVLGHAEHHQFVWAEYERARVLLPARLTPIIEWAHAEVEGVKPNVG